MRLVGVARKAYKLIPVFQKIIILEIKYITTVKKIERTVI